MHGQYGPGALKPDARLVASVTCTQLFVSGLARQITAPAAAAVRASPTLWRLRVRADKQRTSFMPLLYISLQLLDLLNLCSASVCGVGAKAGP